MNHSRKHPIGLLLAAGLLVAASVVPSPAAAIVGGERVAAADAPWAVSLMLPPRAQDRRTHHCTGTAIAPRRVLTARHCVEHDDVWRWRVVTGTDDPERQAGSQTRVAHVWAPLLYDHDDPRASLNDRDLAVVETTGDLSAPALPLAAAATVAAPGEPVWSYGFGLTDGEADGSNGPSMLRRGELLMYTPEQCAESDFGDVATALCARRSDGPGGGVIRRGDSGGGLVRQGAGGPELLGVNSVLSVSVQADSLSGFASVPASHAFVTAPESGFELPIPQGKATISGGVRVGARLRCAAAFAPRPKQTVARWQITPRRGRTRTQQARGAWKVPASARGARVACAVFGGLSARYGSTTEWSRAATVRR